MIFSLSVLSNTRESGGASGLSGIEIPSGRPFNPSNSPSPCGEAL
jgi:hypothetical protein